MKPISLFFSLLLLGTLAFFTVMPSVHAAGHQHIDDKVIMFDPFEEGFFFSSVKVAGTMRDAQSQKLEIQGGVRSIEYPGKPGNKEINRYSLPDLVDYYNWWTERKSPTPQDFKEQVICANTLTEKEEIEENFHCTLNVQEDSFKKEPTQEAQIEKEPPLTKGSKISMQIDLKNYVALRIKDENSEEIGLLLVPVWSILLEVKQKKRREFVVIDENGHSEIDRAIFIGGTPDSFTPLREHKHEVKLQKKQESYVVRPFTLRFTEEEIEAFQRMGFSFLHESSSIPDGKKYKEEVIEVGERREVIEQLEHFFLSRSRGFKGEGATHLQKATWYAFGKGAAVGAFLALLGCWLIVNLKKGWKKKKGPQSLLKSSALASKKSDADSKK